MCPCESGVRQATLGYTTLNKSEQEFGFTSLNCVLRILKAKLDPSI